VTYARISSRISGIWTGEGYKEDMEEEDEKRKGIRRKVDDFFIVVAIASDSHYHLGKEPCLEEGQ
jgi:hypothetical protein